MQLTFGRVDQNLSRLSQPGLAPLFRFGSARLLRLGSTQRGSPASARLHQQATNHAAKASYAKGAFAEEDAIRAQSVTVVTAHHTADAAPQAVHTSEHPSFLLVSRRGDGSPYPSHPLLIRCNGDRAALNFCDGFGNCDRRSLLHQGPTFSLPSRRALPLHQH
jgi:hypothetical protein